MTYREAYQAATARLAERTLTPDLDARVLLAHVAGLDTARLFARWPDALPGPAGLALETALTRRLAGEPVAWITGSKEFLGLEFHVPPGLLVPRADTETLVEAALELTPGPRVIDVATGTGCVAVGLAALSSTPLEVWACDLSPLAVATTRDNAGHLLAPPRTVTVVESDLLTAVPGRWNLVVSNPPYLTRDETRHRVEREGWREPALALDGGPDGLDLIRRLVTQAAHALLPGGWLLIEAADAQSDAIADLYTAAGLGGVRVWRDLAGQRRVTGARLSG